MPDIMSSDKRSRLMSRIKGKGTQIEKAIERELRRRGIYFATHARELPGRPDVVFRRKRVAVFIDGDFWHGWRFPDWRAKIPEFWQAKIEKNRRRDRRNFATLRRRGWKVVRIWEHAIKVDVFAQVDRICDALQSR